MNSNPTVDALLGSTFHRVTWGVATLDLCCPVLGMNYRGQEEKREEAAKTMV